MREPRIHRRAFSLPHPLGLPSYSPFRFRFQTRTRGPGFHPWLFHVPYATPFDGPLIAVANERHGYATMNRCYVYFIKIVDDTDERFLTFEWSYETELAMFIQVTDIHPIRTSIVYNQVIRMTW